MSRYTFRDTDPAEVRLALLAKVFEPEMRVLLARLPERPVRFALDLDSLPGFSWMSSNRNALWEWIYPGVTCDRLGPDFRISSSWSTT